MGSAKFELLHAGSYLSDAWDMADALNAVELWANLGYVNLEIRRKADGKVWKYNPV